MEDTLNLAPFPTLQWDGVFWQGRFVLSAWRGFQSRQGAYTSKSSEAASDGTVILYVITPDNERSLPVPEQAAAFTFLLAEQDAVRDAVLQAVFAEYPKLQELYGYDAAEAEAVMPDIESADQLKPLIGLSNVHLWPSESGNAKVGFEFGCLWDEEHGLGVLTHAGKVVEVGQADVSF